MVATFKVKQALRVAKVGNNIPAPVYYYELNNNKPLIIIAMMIVASGIIKAFFMSYLKYCILVISLVCLSLTGCSTLLVQNSKLSDVLKAGTHRQEVIAKLGGSKSTETSIDAVGDDKTPCVVDSYIVTGKIPDQNLATLYMQMDVMTFGAGEIILFPFELIRTVIASFSTKEKVVSVMYCRRQGVEVVSGVPTYH